MDWFINNFKMVQWVIWIVFALIIWALAVTFVKRKEHSASNEKHKEAHDNLIIRVSQIELTYNKEAQHIHLATRVQKLETKVEALPDKTTIHRVESEVKELKGLLTGINQLQKRMNNQVDMLVENEIKGSKN
jgi:hypothetical protein